MLCVLQHIDVVHFLVERIKDNKPQANYGHTPLHLAATNGHIDVVRFLVDRIKDKNPQDNLGRTPLDCATRYPEIVQFLSQVPPEDAKVE